MVANTYTTGDVTKEQYNVDIGIGDQLKVSVSLYTALESDIIDGNAWRGVLEVNNTSVFRWHGRTCADVAAIGEGMLESIYNEFAKSLGVLA